MTRSRSGIQAPQPVVVQLGELSDGTPDLLGPDADLDGVAFDDVEVSTLDLRGGTLRECRLRGVQAREGDWRATRLLETTIERLDLPVLRATRGEWRDVRIEGSRLGSVEAYDTTWRSVHLVGCKLSYLNLRSARLLDVTLTDCLVDELDLAQADLRRVAFHSTSVFALDLGRATCEHLDLRGCDLEEIRGLDGLRGTTINPAQLTRLAPALARDLGITVEGG